MILYPEYQFVYPIPKGNELIFSAPFRDGVFRENQFVEQVYKRIYIKTNSDSKFNFWSCHITFFLFHHLLPNFITENHTVICGFSNNSSVVFLIGHSC